MMRGTIIAALLILLAGCSDKTTEERQDARTDRSLVDLLSLPDEGVPVCGPKTYPCGPYGTRTNDVAANLEFLGFSDPDEMCKAHDKKAQDTSKLRRIAFKDWYQADPTGACNRKLLWVIVSAGWCGPCQEEVRDAATQYKGGQVDSRLGILNVVFETDNPGTPADGPFLNKWTTKLGLTFPVVMDPSFKMGAYFTREATPFNMLIDTSTMKIFYQLAGGDASFIGPQILAFFNKK